MDYINCDRLHANYVYLCTHLCLLERGPRVFTLDSFSKRSSMNDLAIIQLEELYMVTRPGTSATHEHANNKAAHRLDSAPAGPSPEADSGAALG